jgi:integrase/recombinase XerD
MENNSESTTEPNCACCHTLRATGITTYLHHDGKLEAPQQMVAHESARTTDLYDRRGDEFSLDEVQQIAI